MLSCQAPDMLSSHLLLGWQARCQGDHAACAVFTAQIYVQDVTCLGVLGTLRLPSVVKRCASSCAWVTDAGDWLCESCNAVNFANRMECFKCYEPR